IAERLDQEIHGAVLDRPHRGRDIAMSGYENDRRIVALRDLPLQVEPVDVRQLDIEDKAGWDIRLVRIDIIASRPECDRVHAMRGQRLAERLTDSRVVIHDEYDMIARCHDTAIAPRGKVKMNAAP